MKALALPLIFVAITAFGQPKTAGPADPKLIEDLILANRILAMEGVVDAMGHVSVRHNRDPNRYLISLARAPELVTAEDIAEYDLDSNLVVPTQRRQYSERYIHGEIYKARPDVMAVIHNHSPEIIPFGVSKVPLRAVTHSGGFFAEPVPVWEPRTQFGMTEMLVNNPPLGQSLVKSLGSHAAVLMRGHGVAVVGPTLQHVVGRAVYLQVGARLQAQAIALGTPVTYLDPEEGRKIEARRDYIRSWELWKRKATGK
jgi:ribulose-5-phosphate 4-epimerase/fuculose-1-phosphate aldolase